MNKIAAFAVAGQVPSKIEDIKILEAEAIVWCAQSLRLMCGQQEVFQERLKKDHHLAVSLSAAAMVAGIKVRSNGQLWQELTRVAKNLERFGKITSEERETVILFCRAIGHMEEEAA